MHLFVAGLGRAGTTLLANLLTSPPSRWLLIEPGITRGDMGEHVRQQAARFGLSLDAQAWSRHASRPARERFDRFLAPVIASLSRWGVKEVNPAGWDDLLAEFKPKHVVLMVRDLRDAGLSVLEKEDQQAGQRKSEDWLFERLSAAAQALTRLYSSLHPARRTVVRYEDFVSSSEYRNDLARRLDWPLDGDPGQRLDLYGRSYEVQRHAGRITPASVGRSTRETSSERLQFADRLHAANESFARAFGYVE